MAFFFKDRLPDKIHGQNARFYDAVASDGSIKLSDFKLILKNNISPENEGEPVSAGNLNFASGNMSLCLSKGQAIRRGSALTLTPGGASLANMRPRPIAATSTQTQLQTVLKLTDTKILIAYSTPGQHPAGTVVVADIDWEEKTLSMGAAHAIANVSTLEVISSSSFCFVIRNQWMSGNLSGNAELHLCTVSGRTVTTHPGMNITNGTASNAGSLTSNPAVMSGNTVAIAHEWAGTSTYRVFEYTVTGDTFVRGSLLGEVTKTQRNILELVRLSGGKALLHLQNWSTGALAAHTFGFPAVHTLNLNESGWFTMPRRHGGAMRYDALGANRAAVLNTTGGGCSLRFISVNPETGAMTAGGIQRVPKIYGAPDFTVDSAGRLIITGTIYQDGFAEVAFYETEYDGAALSFAEYQPFRDTRLSTGVISSSGVPSHQHWGMAVENASNPGEFLFARHSSTGSPTMAQFSFGYKGDSANSGNIAGMALEDSADGRVRAQISGKLLPGLTGGLKQGLYYSIGADGALAVHDGSTPPVGIAAGADDFIYYGAKSWRA